MTDYEFNTRQAAKRRKKKDKDFTRGHKRLSEYLSNYGKRRILGRAN